MPQVPSGLEWSEDCFRVIPNRFPVLYSASRPEKKNAATVFNYTHLAALSVVAGARNHRDRHLIEVPV